MSHPTVIHCTRQPFDGGAGIAAGRLVSGLRGAGLEAQMLGLECGPQKEEWISKISYRNSLHERLWRRWRKRQIESTPLPSMPRQTLSKDRSPHGMALNRALVSADIVHLHWVADFIDYTRFFADVKKPIVWTLHDMTPFTGGCFHSMGCRRFESSCGRCPMLIEPSFDVDETWKSLVRKRQAVSPRRPDLTLISPSRWLLEEAKRSSVFAGVKGEVIRNGLDLNIFNPEKRKAGRALLELGDHEPLLLFVAANLDQSIKGLKVLLVVLQELIEMVPQTRVAYMGRSNSALQIAGCLELGEIKDESKKAEIYAAADVLVVPSLAENSPNVICEAQACGTPVVGSDVGGIPELIEDGRSGWLFEAGDSSALQKRLTLVLREFPTKRQMWRDACRSKAESEYAIDKIAAAHVGLYSRLLNQT